MANIQWYPGHMEKARRQMNERLQAVDMVIELRDARMPLASANPLLATMAQGKPRLIVLTKIDHADPKKTQEWIGYFIAGGCRCIALDLLKDNHCGKKIVRESLALMEERRQKQIARGIRPRAVRAMVCGIPNVGKSTLINRIFGKNALKAQDRPGVTRSLTWIHADEQLDLLDTPGVLWPKFDDPKTGSILAALGSINDDILDQKMVAMDTIRMIQNGYPGLLETTYETGEVNPNGMLKGIAKKRNLITSGNLDTKRAAILFLNELRKGKLGRLTLEDAYEEDEENMFE